MLLFERTLRLEKWGGYYKMKSFVFFKIITIEEIILLYYSNNKKSLSSFNLHQIKGCQLAASSSYPLTTMFTSLSGTTIVLMIVFPSINSMILSILIASLRRVSLSNPLACSNFALSFPFI